MYWQIFIPEEFDEIIKLFQDGVQFPKILSNFPKK